MFKFLILMVLFPTNSFSTGLNYGLVFRDMCIKEVNTQILNFNSDLYSSLETKDLISEKLTYYSPFYCGCLAHRLKYSLKSSGVSFGDSKSVDVEKILNSRSFIQNKIECQDLAREAVHKVLAVDFP